MAVSEPTVVNRRANSDWAQGSLSRGVSQQQLPNSGDVDLCEGVLGATTSEKLTACLTGRPSPAGRVHFSGDVGLSGATTSESSQREEPGPRTVDFTAQRA